MAPPAWHNTDLKLYTTLMRSSHRPVARAHVRRYGPGSGADFLLGEGPSSVLRFENVTWIRQVCLLAAAPINVDQTAGSVASVAAPDLQLHGCLPVC